MEFSHFVCYSGMLIHDRLVDTIMKFFIITV